MSPSPEATGPLPRSGLARPLRALHRLEDTVLALLLGSMIVLACAQILLRNLFDSGIVWLGPLLRYMVLWVGLLGALCATRSQEHIAIDALSRALPDLWRRLSLVIAHAFTASVCGVIAYHALRLVRMDREAASLAFAEVPVWAMESVIPLAFAGMALRFALRALACAHGLRSRSGGA